MPCVGISCPSAARVHILTNCHYLLSCPSNQGGSILPSSSSPVLLSQRLEVLWLGCTLANWTWYQHHQSNFSVTAKSGHYCFFFFFSFFQTWVPLHVAALPWFPPPRLCSPQQEGRCWLMACWATCSYWTNLFITSIWSGGIMKSLMGF